MKDYEKKYKVYLATPVNGRPEPTLKLKRKAAYERIEFLKTMPHPQNWDAVSSFDVCPLNEEITEAEAMGRCISLLMTCDVMVVDRCLPINGSKGVKLEMECAKLYGIKIIERHRDYAPEETLEQCMQHLKLKL